MAGEEGELNRVAVNYRRAERERRCETCARFEPQARACGLVAGGIAANMVCDRWVILPGVTVRDLDLPPRR